MTVFAVGGNINYLSEFRDVFRMRYVGLVDASSTVYNSWRVPNPQAPYPQDYIIDQQGTVRYWSDQFDAQEVIRTIDRLLATGIEEELPPVGPDRIIPVEPNPTRGSVEVRAAAAGAPSPSELRLISADGRVVSASAYDARRTADGILLDLRGLPAGVYFLDIPSAPATRPARVVLAD